MPVPSSNYYSCISLLLSAYSGNSVFLVKSITFHPLLASRPHAGPACQENPHTGQGVISVSDAAGGWARRVDLGPGLCWGPRGQDETQIPLLLSTG